MTDSGLTIIQHLDEFRKRLIYCLLAVIVGSVISYNFAGKLLYFLAKPVGKLVFIHPTEAFMSYLKLAVFCGIILSSPVIIYQVWAFTSPGLKFNERKYILLLAPISLLLFFSGCAFSYFVVIPLSMKFLTSFGSDFLVPMISVSSFVSFFCMMVLIFGVVFQLPMLILFLSKMGVVNPAILRKNRKYAVLLIFIAAAVLTPTPDVFTQTFMAVPLVVLYELSIFVSYFGGKKSKA